MIELRRRYSGGVQSPSFSRLPEGYQEVEWIRPSAKGAYINTGIIPNDNLDFNVKFSAYTYDGIQMIFGTKDPQYRIYFVSTSNSIESQFPNWGTYYWISDNAGFGVYTFSKEGSLFKLNDLYYNYAISGIESISNIHLFNSSNEGGYYSTNYLYYASFKDNGVIVREFIPCYRISDRVAGMYDIVNDVFYTNVGTGKFLYGPDVHYNIPFEYQEVEYLESTGTQYIDTGVSAPDGFVFEANLEITKQVGQIDCIIGAHELSQPYKLNLFGVSTVYNAGLFISAGTIDVHSHTKEYNRKYSVQASTQKGYIYVLLDATPILSDTNLELRTSRNLFIFADNNVANGASQYSAIRLWNNAKIIVNNVLVRNFIPCYRKEDEVAGMYDLVSGEFYPNAGTGTFKIGPDII